jgi:hypothetical protein
MAELQVTPDDLLAGAAVTYDLIIPPNILQPGQNGQTGAKDQSSELIVQLRPLTIGSFQLIMKAARNDPTLIPLLMIKEALVQPALSIEQVKRLHLGLVNFLIAHIREISGLTEKKRDLTG